MNKTGIAYAVPAIYKLYSMNANQAKNKTLLSNQKIIEQMFRNYAAGNMSAVLSSFDKDIVWLRPGAPSIPFSGIFKGVEEVTKMFAIQATTLTMKSFLPGKICTNEDTVVVLGHDTVDVIPTGKTYFN